jgi:type II pantothenate kinase
MDVGGTLTKIVYFQANNTRNNQSDSTEASVQSPPLRNMKSSEHLAQLESPDHQAALQELYNYMDPNTGLLASRPQSGIIRDSPLTVFSNYLDGTLHFLHFETRNMISAINYVSSTAVTENIKSIGCTGGGAHKYDANILEQLDIQVNKYDELGCLVRGMLFALTNFPDELYTYRNADELDSDDTDANDDGDDVPVSVKRWQKDSKEYTKKVTLPYPAKSSFPYLIVNIGSGVSILKVSGPGQYERVSGTSLGGGTYWGLCRLMTKCATYEEVLDLAENGDAGTVDMLVKDIYGGDCKCANFLLLNQANLFANCLTFQK